MKSRIPLLIGILVILVVSGCSASPQTSPSKYTMNEFVSATSINLNGVQPQIDGSSHAEIISWGARPYNSTRSVSIFSFESPSRAEQAIQDYISSWNDRKDVLKYTGYTSKTISGQQIITSQMEFQGEPTNYYMWSKDNFFFMLEEIQNTSNPHIDELASRIISIYSK